MLDKTWIDIRRRNKLTSKYKYIKCAFRKDNGVLSQNDRQIHSKRRCLLVTNCFHVVNATSLSTHNLPIYINGYFHNFITGINYPSNIALFQIDANPIFKP